MIDPHVGYTDSLVLNIQLIHDGDIPHWACVNDPHEDTTQWLCQICTWGRWLGNFGKPDSSQPSSLSCRIYVSDQDWLISHGHSLIKSHIAAFLHVQIHWNTSHEKVEGMNLGNVFQIASLPSYIVCWESFLFQYWVEYTVWKYFDGN
jgi:hypothetical protein